MTAKRRREGKCEACGGEALPKYRYGVLVGVEMFCQPCKIKHRLIVNRWKEKQKQL